MWGHFPNSRLINNLVLSQVKDCSRELDWAAQCLGWMRLSGVACAIGTISLESCSSVARNCRGLGLRATSAALRLRMQTRIRLSLILSAQLYSEAVRILDIKTVRARLHFQTATL